MASARVFHLGGAQSLRTDAAALGTAFEVHPLKPSDIASPSWWELVLGGQGTQRTTVIAYDGAAHSGTLQQLESMRERVVRWGPGDGDRDDVPFWLVPVDGLLGRPAVESDALATAAEQRVRVHINEELRGTRGPVLLEGETGTGKTRIAGWMHSELFGRGSGSFRTLNCAALDPRPEAMGTLFRGVVANHYTAVKACNGVFVDMDGGTLFLDEFQELETSVQATLLDMVQPFSTRISGHRMGENKQSWKADVQVVFAINRSLADLLEAGKLRSDLHFRIWRRVRLTPLRELLRSRDARPEGYLRARILRMQESGFMAHPQADAVGWRQSLAMAFGCVAPDHGELQSLPAMTTRSMPVPATLVAYDWPGNFRELESVAHRLMKRGGLAHWDSNDMEAAFQRLVPTKGTLDTQPQRSAAELVGQAWLAAMGVASRTQAARELGLDARTFMKRVELLARADQNPCKEIWFFEAMTPGAREALRAHAEGFIARHRSPSSAR